MMKPLLGELRLLQFVRVTRVAPGIRLETYASHVLYSGGRRSFLKDTQDRINRFARDSTRWGSFPEGDGRYPGSPFDPRKRGGLLKRINEFVDRSFERLEVFMEKPPSRSTMEKVDKLEHHRAAAARRLQPVLRSPMGQRAYEWRYRYKRWVDDRTPYPVTFTMLVLAGMTYLLWGFAPPKFMNRNFTVSRENLTHGRLHTLLTASLSHTSFMHLLVNSLVVFVYGSQLEKLLGGPALLRIAVTSAIAGSLGHVLTATDRRDAAVGGSGVAFGLLTAACLLEPNLMVYVWGMWPISQKKLLAGVLALEGIWAFASLGDDQAGALVSHSPGVSHSAHLLGAASAPLALYWLRWFSKIR